MANLQVATAAASCADVSSTRCVLLLGGKGNVGVGCLDALVEAGYDVIVIDPAEGGKVVEDVGDDELGNVLVKCAEIVYTAEDGNRDNYLADGVLEESNNKRFECFVRRAKELVQAREGAMPRLSYIGGSWTKRQHSDELVVGDDSPNKQSSPIHYERAKASAQANAQALSEELGVSIIFFDWTSVVPNFSSNFTISKMTAQALQEGAITYSAGDYGRPLLHRRDAGRAMIAIWQDLVERFEVVLQPGLFTPFKTFAEVVQTVVEGARGSEVRLQTQDSTPDFLRVRAESARLEALGFTASADLVREGLEEACRAALKRFTT